MAYKSLLKGKGLTVEDLSEDKLEKTSLETYKKANEALENRKQGAVPTLPSSSPVPKTTPITISPVPAKTSALSKLDISGSNAIANMNKARASVVDREKAIRGGSALGSMGLNTIGSIGKTLTATGDVIAGRVAAEKAEDTVLAKEMAEKERLEKVIKDLSYQYAHNSTGLANNADYQFATKKLASLNRVIDAVKNKVANETEDIKADRAMNNLLGISDELRKTSLEGLSPTEQMIGSTAMSLGESAMLMPTALINPYLYRSLSAAKNAGRTMYDKEQQGYSEGDAYTRGLLSGGVTFGTSKLGLDAALKGMTGKALTQGGLKGAVANRLLGSAGESLEGGIEYTADTFLDNAYGEDKKWTFKDFLTQAALEGIGSLAIGSAMDVYGGLNAIPATKATPKTPDAYDNSIVYRAMDLPKINEIKNKAWATLSDRTKLNEVRQQLWDKKQRGTYTTEDKLFEDTLNQMEKGLGEIKSDTQVTGSEKGSFVADTNTTLQKNLDEVTRVAEEQKKMADEIAGEAYGADTVGAARYNPDSYRAKLDEANTEYGTLPPGENAVRLGELPKKLDDTDRKMSRFANTGVNAEITSDEFAKTIEKEAAEGKFLYEVVHNKDLKEKAQASINKNGFDKSLEHWNYLIENNSKITPEDIAIAQTLYNHANNHFAKTGDRTAFNEARKLFADMQLVYTLNGQVTQTARMMRNTTPDGNLYVLEKLIDNINSKSKKHKVELNGELAQKLLNSKDVDEMVNNVNAIKDDIASQIYTNFGSLINEWRYFTMLANPKTHIRNIVGNTVMNEVYGIKDAIGAAVEGVTDKTLKITRGKGLEERSKAVLNKFSEKDKGLIDFARNDYETNMAGIVQGNGSKYSEKTDITSRANVWTQNVVARKFSDITGGKSDALGKLINAVTKGNMKALENADNRALKRNYTRALAEYMKANKHTAEFYKSAEGQVAFAKARDYATRQAKEATFHDDSRVADALGRLQDSHTLAGIAIGATVPFKKTPINIAKRAIEYSPVGLAKGGMDIVKGTGSVQAIDDIAKGITGTSLMAIGAWLASKGILNGVVSGDDERERKLKLAQGHQDFAVEIGGKSITIESFAPSAIPMLMGASLYETMESKDGIGLSAGDIADALAAMNNPMVEMSVLSAVDDILESVKYGDDKIGAISSAVASNYANQFVPTIFGNIARTLDDTKRTTYIDKNSPYGKVGEDIIQSMKYKGVRSHQTLEPSLDVWGREQSEGTLGERIFNNFINPTSIKDINTTAVDEEISRLYNNTGETSVLPNKPDKYIKVDKKRIDFTAPEYTELVKGKNNLSYTDLAEMFTMPEYQSLSDEQKAQLVEKVYEYNGINAKENVTGFKYNSDLDDKLDELTTKGKFSTAEAIMHSYMLTELGKLYNKEAQTDYIEGLDATKEQKKLLEDLKVSDWVMVYNDTNRAYTDGAGDLGNEGYILSGLSKSANKAWPDLKGEYSAEEMKEFDKLMVTKKAESETNFLNAGHSKSEFEKIWKAFH